MARAERLTRQAQLEDYCRFECGDAMAMPYPDGSFDVVYAIESACHMPDKARFYANCARVLQPGGRPAGWDWVRTRFLSPAEHERLIEPICRYFAIPDVCTLDDIGAWIRAGSGRTMVWVAAGAACADSERNVPSSHGYSFGALERGKSGLTVRISPRIWRDDQQRFVADSPGSGTTSEYRLFPRP